MGPAPTKERLQEGIDFCFGANPEMHGELGWLVDSEQTESNIPPVPLEADKSENRFFHEELVGLVPVITRGKMGLRSVLKT